MSSDDNLGEKVKGVAKEVAAKVTGSDELAKEGEAQQKKAQNAEEAERLEQEAAAKRQESAGYKGEQKAREIKREND